MEFSSGGSVKTTRVLTRVNTKTSRDKIKANQINSVDPADGGDASPSFFGLGGETNIQSIFCMFNKYFAFS